MSSAHRATATSFNKLFKPIADALRSRRRAMGLRQKDLSKKTGYHEGQISRWERCIEIPRGSCLLNWCQSVGAYLIVAGENPGPEFKGRAVPKPPAV